MPTMKKRISLGLVYAALAFACSAPLTDSSSEPSAAVDADTAAVDTNAATAAATATATATVAMLEGPSAPGASLESSLVVHVGEQAYVVLDASTELAWGSEGPSGPDGANVSERAGEGPPELTSVENEGVYAVTRKLSPLAVPARAKAAQGKHVRLYGAAGVVCDAVVDEVKLLGRFSPDSDVYARWHGEARDEADRPLPKPSRAEMADEAWTISEGAIVLAATLRPSGKCAGATFALLGEDAQSTPTIGTSAKVAKLSAADDTTTTRALAAFRALPEYATHAAEYLTFATENESTVTAASWDRHAESSPQVTLVTLESETLVWVTANVDGGCGDFGATLSVLYRSTPGGLEVVRVLDGVSASLEGVVPRAEGYELVFPESHVGPKAEDEVFKLEVRTFGCSC